MSHELSKLQDISLSVICDKPTTRKRQSDAKRLEKTLNGGGGSSNIHVLLCSFNINANLMLLIAFSEEWLVQFVPFSGFCLHKKVCYIQGWTEVIDSFDKWCPI